MTTTVLDHEIRDQVTEVLVRYASGIDGRDWELFRTCFTEECDVDYGDIGRWSGVDEITAWMAETHDPLGPTLHLITNVALTPTAGGIGARSSVHAVLLPPETGSAIHAYGWYEDELLVTPSGWRIARRRFTTITTEVHGP